MPCRIRARKAAGRRPGSLRDDLERWTTDVATDLTDPDGLALMRAAVGSGAGASRACMADRHAQLAAILDRERAPAARYRR